MIKKIIPFFFLLLPFFAFAKKKKPLKYISGITYYEKHGNKEIGNIYELTVTILKDSVLIDSIQFDAMVVPCDVYSHPNKQRFTKGILKGKYVIKGNKDLYKNFYPDFYKTQEYIALKYKHEVIIWYLYKGKRYKLPILNVAKGSAKPMRG